MKKGFPQKHQISSVAVILIIFLAFVEPLTAATKTSLVKEGWPNHKTTAFSAEELRQVHAFVTSQTDIPFKFIEDGCHVRSREVAIRLANKRFEVSTVIIEPLNKEELLLGGYRFHHATFVYLKQGKNLIPMVMDPSFFPSPVALNEWTKLFSEPGKFKIAFQRYAPPTEDEIVKQERNLRLYTNLQDLKEREGITAITKFMQKRRCVSELSLFF